MNDQLQCFCTDALIPIGLCYPITNESIAVTDRQVHLKVGLTRFIVPPAEAISLFGGERSFL